MWIRSQNETKLINSSEIRAIRNDKEGNLKPHIISYPGNEIIGQYKSVERTLMVIDEIQDFLENSTETVFKMPKE